MICTFRFGTLRHLMTPHLLIDTILIPMTEGPNPVSSAIERTKLHQCGNLLQLDVDFGLRIFIWVWTTSLMVVQYFFTWLRQKKAYIMEAQINGGSIADKVNIARNYFEKEVSVGAVFVMDSRVSQADRAWHPKEAFGAVFVMDSRVSPADRA